VYGAPSGRGEQSLRRNWPNGSRRLASVDAVYAQRWNEVDNQRRIPDNVGVSPRPWSDFTSRPEPRRWYANEDLKEALESQLGGRGASNLP
jgi:hypothetical protein